MLKEYFSFDGNKEKQAEFLDKYLREKFRMVSMLPDGFDEKQQRQKGDPVKILLDTIGKHIFEIDHY